MRKDITITAAPATRRGKNEARRLRVAVCPGGCLRCRERPVAVSVSPKEVNQILRSTSGHNTIFNVDVQGRSRPVMMVDWQHDPIKGKLLHVDLKRIDLNKRIIVKVPVHTTGRPEGRQASGRAATKWSRAKSKSSVCRTISRKTSRSTSANCHRPEHPRQRSLAHDGSMKLLSPADAVISHVVGSGAEAVAEEAAAVAEPEVVKKGKKEEEAATPEEGRRRSSIPGSGRLNGSWLVVGLGNPGPRIRTDAA